MSGEGKYQVMPDIDTETRNAMKASMQQFGIIVPVVYDQHGNIIDGHNRVAIAEELGLDFPKIIERVEDEEHAARLAATLNSERRQLTKEQRVGIVASLRAKGYSQRAIAGALGVSRPTVAADYLVAGGLPPDEAPAVIVGRDGKRYPPKGHDEATRQAALNRVAAGEKFNVVAESLGVSQSTVSRWVKNQRDATERAAPRSAEHDRSYVDRPTRVAQITALAAEGHTGTQIAEQLGITVERVRLIAKEESIHLHDFSHKSYVKRSDPNRAVAAIVDHVYGVESMVEQVSYDALNLDDVDHWLDVITSAIKSLNSMKNNLKKVSNK